VYVALNCTWLPNTSCTKEDGHIVNTSILRVDCSSVTRNGTIQESETVFDMGNPGVGFELDFDDLVTDVDLDKLDLDDDAITVIKLIPSDYKRCYKCNLSHKYEMEQAITIHNQLTMESFRDDKF